MTEDRWRQISAIYQAALEEAPETRQEYLQQACAGDEELKRDIESLLQHDGAAALVDTPALDTAAKALAPGSGQTLIGSDLGVYEITGFLGAGGMGEVYRARDRKLGRRVALKLLPSEWAADPERRARFEREARLLASLNHPNIGAIYGIEEDGPLPALVLELVEGPTLADRLEKGALPVEEALGIAGQLADGLDAAHQTGIVHRDLKPANIKISPDGRVKVLDFGLAKHGVGDHDGSGVTNLAKFATINLGGTRKGVLLGTAAYMSPEQARGQTIDKRTDIWAFGCVLYEMLSGRKAFGDGPFSDTIAAILKSEPDWNALPVRTPSSVRLLLRRCLSKDPRERLRDIADWRIVAPEAATGELQAPGPSKSLLSLRHGLLSLFVGAVILLVVSGLGVSYLARFPRSVPEMRVEITTPPTPDPVSFAISPNGGHVVFLASSGGSNTQLWLRPLNSVEAQPLVGTDGASYPFWSPDSRAIAFFAEGKLKRIDLTGGPSRTLTSAPQARGGSWSKDGVILFTPGPRASLYRVASSGGEALAVTRLDPPRLTSHRVPYFLPDGRHFLFQGLGDSEAGVYIASLDQPDPRRVLNADSGAVYAVGHLLFARGGTLFAQRFDAGKLQAAGEPFRVAGRVASQVGFAVSSAGNGTVVYRSENRPEVRQLAWFDRAGQVSGYVGSPDKALPLNPKLSPDGKRVAVERAVGSQEVWLMEVAGGEPSRLTFGGYRWPVWSPDGSRVMFASVRTGSWRLYQRLATGAGQEDQVAGLTDVATATDCSPDGRFLLFDSEQLEVGRVGGLANRGYEIWAQQLDGSSKSFRAVTSPGDQRNGQFSPDGHWIAYQSNEDGKQEIYVQRFPGQGGKIQISTTGGTQPRWRANGRELFYVGLDGKLMATPISFLENGTAIKAGTPSPLFSTHLVGEATVNRPQVNRQQYDVSPDGQRFLMNITIEPEATSPFTAILNWRAEPEK